MKKIKTPPFVATHPGEMIKDELKERGMPQKQQADETGIKASVLSKTVNGKRSVSLSVAVALEKALGISTDIWINMQTQHDLDIANIAERGNQHETVAVTIPLRDRNLLKELVRKFEVCKPDAGTLVRWVILRFHILRTSVWDGTKGSTR